MENYKFKLYTPHDKATTIQIDQITVFLSKNLNGIKKDKPSIRHAIAYAFKEKPGLGGFVITLKYNDELIGATVVNETGMKGYFPANLLVYIAIRRDYRGKGLGRKLMKHALRICQKDVFLNVDYDNSAKGFFEKFGFKNQYLSMRILRKTQK